MSPDCPDKNKIPRERWAIKRAEQHLQAENNENEETEQDRNTQISDVLENTDIPQSNTRSSGWSGMQCSLLTKEYSLTKQEFQEHEGCDPFGQWINNEFYLPMQNW